MKVTLWAIVALTAPHELAFGLEAPQLPGGYYVSQNDLAIALPASIADTLDNHKIRVYRRFSNLHEEQLLRTAEALYPPRDSVIAGAERGARSRRDVRRAQIESVRSDIDLWWYSEDDIRLPYAVTGSALLYYIELSRRFREGSLREPQRIPRRTELTYLGTIEHHKSTTIQEITFSDVYVARLTLAWSFGCPDTSRRPDRLMGWTCGPWFRISRVVVLSKDRSVLAVFGDHPAPFLVS